MKQSQDVFLVSAVLALAALVPATGNPYLIGVGFNLLMWIALATSWSSFSSLTGFVSLGHVAFYGLGTYVTVLLWDVVPLPLALTAATLAGGAFALLIGIPVLRVRGPYFVILTLGIAELLKNGVSLLESSLGEASRLILDAPDLPVLYGLAWGAATVAIAIGYLLRRSPRWHLGLRAIRANEEASAAAGINASNLKLAALLLSAVVPAFVGGISLLRSTYFEPNQAFSSMTSFTMIAMAIVGGGDALRGPVLGAIGLCLLQEVLWANLPQLYPVVLGALLVVFVLFAPQGISGLLDDLSAWRHARSQGRAQARKRIGTSTTGSRRLP
ncbi:branched-chain amino acid ABC transporter permease [Paraburkholderia sediminicola]|jgi:branched-chain amino acid transport system permease protein|uniref:branched-chain amino acid ABC transporter permease n=1 Tax=Paraburkholderia sediminicola TaxID=458836 RepID=UPI0038BB9FEC